jgi:hypothetical protein
VRLRVLALALLIVTLFGGLVGCDVSCPAALLEGVLIRHGETLVVEMADGTDTNVRWPFGYHVGGDGDRLVLMDLFGSVKAREGDVVHLGGGMVQPDEAAFGVCGPFTVDRA